MSIVFFYKQSSVIIRNVPITVTEKNILNACVHTTNIRNRNSNTTSKPIQKSNTNSFCPTYLLKYN